MICLNLNDIFFFHFSFCFLIQSLSIYFGQYCFLFFSLVWTSEALFLSRYITWLSITSLLVNCKSRSYTKQNGSQFYFKEFGESWDSNLIETVKESRSSSLKDSMSDELEDPGSNVDDQSNFPNGMAAEMCINVHLLITLKILNKLI